ncbi:MAG: hypothetical protein DRO67_00265 [Candidatus Asgardarchaeum californiense]|nr:MAG: hypothetical protein DRO67_00265 [Candidatus Asgardarchaeum californiense]
MNLNNYTKIPVEEAIIPKNGSTVYVDKYWCIVDNCVLFYRDVAPQCNSNREIAERVAEKLYPEATVQFIPRIYK